MNQTRTLAILIFDDVEVLDFCGPFEVFSVANRFTDPPAFNVLTVAEKAGPVLTRGGLSVNPHHRLADCPQPDLLLVPGGQGTRKEMHNPALIDWIRQASAKAELVLSVCTGALLLAKAGLLDGLEATTHHGAIDLLRQTAPKTTVHADRRFVDNGRVVCSAGIAAGIDMSLHVVSRLLGQEVADEDGPADGVPVGAGWPQRREGWAWLKPPPSVVRPEGVAYADRPAAYAVIAGENGTVAAVKGTTGRVLPARRRLLAGEAAEETIRREVCEELARSIRLIRPIAAATQYFYAADDDRHYKMSAVFFLAEFPDGHAGKGEHDLFWLSAAEAEEAFFHKSHAWAVSPRSEGGRISHGRHAHRPARIHRRPRRHLARQPPRLRPGRRGQARRCPSGRRVPPVVAGRRAGWAGRRPHPLQRLADSHGGRDGAGAGPRPDGGLARTPEAGDRVGAGDEWAGGVPAAGPPDRRGPGPCALLPTVRVLGEADCAPGVAVFGQRLVHGGGVGAWALDGVAGWVQYPPPFGAWV